MDDSNNTPFGAVPHVVHTNDYDDDDDDPHTDYSENATTQNRDNQNPNLQNMICFCILGVCNGFGWYVMLSATYDIIKSLDGVSDNHITYINNTSYSNNSRDCLQTSPAILLLANTIPALLVKILLAFIPFVVNVNIILSCVLASASFIIVALAQHEWHAIVGIIFMSICAGLGDTTAIAYLTKFIDRKNLLLAYSTGGGASGVAASLCYAALTDVGFTPKITLCLMLIVPLLEFLAFIFIRETNAINLSVSTTSLIIDGSTDDTTTTTQTPTTTLSEKMQYLPNLMVYFIPLLISNICEFIINQLFDLLYVPGIWLNHASQYRWLQVLSQIGSFAGRASLSIISMTDVRPLNLLIVIFTIFLAFEAIYMPVPIIFVIFIFVFFVGFVSGCTSINVFYKLTNETPAHYQVFTIAGVSTGVTLGVIVAAIGAIPLHKVICLTPAPF